MDNFSNTAAVLLGDPVAINQFLHLYFDDTDLSPDVEPEVRLAAEYAKLIKMLQWQQEQQYEKPYLEHSAKMMKDILVERHGIEAVRAHVKLINEHYVNTLSDEEYVCFDVGNLDKVH